MLPPYIFTGYRKYLQVLRDGMYIAEIVRDDCRRYKEKRRIGLGIFLAGGILVLWERQLAQKGVEHPAIAILVAGGLLLLAGAAYWVFCNNILRAARRGYLQMFGRWGRINEKVGTGIWDTRTETEEENEKKRRGGPK